ncbi:MAG: DUF4846 domain-containing protein [Bacteroidota bacterium]
MIRPLLFGLFSFLLFSSFLVAQSPSYAWLDEYDESQAVLYHIPPPAGFERMEISANSFADWLRHLPLKAGRPDVYLYNGEKKGNQFAHHAVINMDVGKRDLQQCADAVMRLRAEYLLACGKTADIHFNFTSGDEASYDKYRAGYRANIQGSKVSWVRSANSSDSYRTFRSYMNLVFSYAGTHSLSKELIQVPDPTDLRAGDVFIQGGFPGHAIIVIDVVAHPETGSKRFLLAQSYMPAQEMHILRNPSDPGSSPWYEIPTGTFSTPEWNFDASNLMRFPGQN